jgi:predicted dehydrogenase
VKEPVTIALVGAGNRGADVYARHLAATAGLARFVAVAEPDPLRRDRFAEQHEIPAARRFDSWQQLLAGERLADAVIITTPDQQHVAPARAALQLGYEILLEKPIAPDLAGVLELAAAARTAPGRITVAHVLRHSGFFSAVKELLTEGRIGKLSTVQHTENIGFWHFAHSFVRGNWRREQDTSPMILAKACHDLDLLRWLVDEPCVSVSSYGGLAHFRPENAPPGSTLRCTDGCAVERSCPYSAVRIYLDHFEGRPGWPNSVLAPEPTPATIRQALQEGPYGRCVYRSDNDVADHQAVSLLFESGVTASLTISAFTQDITREIHLMGSHGEIRGRMDTGELLLIDFSRQTQERIEVPATGPGHEEADVALIHDFVTRLGSDPASPALTRLDASIESHLMAFAAERARKQEAGVKLEELRREAGQWYRVR